MNCEIIWYGHLNTAMFDYHWNDGDTWEGSFELRLAIIINKVVVVLGDNVKIKLASTGGLSTFSSIFLKGIRSSPVLSDYDSQEP